MTPMCAMTTRRRHFRRGSAYVAILGAATIIMVISIAAVLSARVRTRSAGWVGDITKARNYAECGMQWAFYRISQVPDWRTRYPNGLWVENQAIDDGTFSVWVTDPADGDLTDWPGDSVVVKAAGYAGQARQLIQVELAADAQPLEALNTCLHAAGQIVVKGGKTITVTGAPLSTNGNLFNDGTIVGDVHAATISRWDIITGTVTCPAPAKNMPYSQVFEMYRALATQIPYTGVIDKQLLTPGRNPYGFTNPDGVYYIDTNGNDLTIRNTRIHGTLVVKCTGKKVILEDRMLIQNYRDDYPVLIIDGGAEIRLKSDTDRLKEDVTRNMNPPGSPYQGQSDWDYSDDYPNEIHGLVHVKADLKIKQTTVIRGVVICEGSVEIDDAPEIIHNSAYYASPPVGYIRVDQMKTSPGSWKQVMP